MAAGGKKQKKKTEKNGLSIDRANGWLGTTAAARKKINQFAGDYRGFISRAKTERECVRDAIAIAEEKGFREFDPDKPSRRGLRPGDRYYCNVAGKTIILFHVGWQDMEKGMRLVGAHVDSPRLDLKPRPLYEDSGMALLDTHYYGGVRKYQWVTIPLALHGVVARKDGSTVDICIGEDPDDPVFTISDLLPHLARDHNEKKLGLAITGEGLNVLFGATPASAEQPSAKAEMLRLLHERYGIDEWDLTSAEIEVVPAGPARDLGLDRSMILGYGHDDRVSAYTACRAVLDLSETPDRTAMVVLCDKEEIGSVGATGMNSRLFENTVAEILNRRRSKYSDLSLRRCLRRSQLLSADVNALHDPNYPEVSSPNHNMSAMNQGVVISKYVGARGKSGSNDASAEFLGELRALFDGEGVLWQTGELGKVDQGGGGTIAHMMARYEMDVVDCGVGVLSMHAPMEVVSKLDVYHAYRAYSAFLAAPNA